MNVLTAPFRLVAWLLVGIFRFIASYPWRVGLGIAGVLIVVGFCSTLEAIPVVSIQRGFRGVGMVQNYDPRVTALDLANHRQPPPWPAVTPSGISSAKAYQNIKVLNDLDSNEFLRLMAAFPTWIAPSTGCAFCHTTVNMA